MMDVIDKIMRISDPHCTSTVIHQHPMDLSRHPVYGANSVDSGGFSQLKFRTNQTGNMDFSGYLVRSSGFRLGVQWKSVNMP
jgi:hypothetical protein